MIRNVTVNGRPNCVLVNGPKDTTMNFWHFGYVISLCDPAEGPDSNRQGRKHVPLRVNEHPIRPADAPAAAARCRIITSTREMRCKTDLLHKGPTKRSFFSIICDHEGD